MVDLDSYAERALARIGYLSVIVGGRGSCSPHERRAAEYAAEQMRELGLSDVRLEPYRGAPSTYRPYALAFGLAAACTLLAWLFESPWTAAVAALANALGIWGMLAETDFASNWMRWLLPKAEAQNAVGIIPSTGEVRRRAVLCAHLDTHRTPVFYSSKRWHKAFTYLVGAALLSLALGAVAYGLLALLGWQLGLWLGAFAALFQVVFLDLCLHADGTPFSPGANDNASGVGVILGLAERLLEEPPAHTEVWLAFTGCEEAGAYGMASFLDAHAATLGDEAVYLILDQVGQGRITYLTADGLIIKRKTHPRALDLARRAAAAQPDLETTEQVGIAYTDAAVATKRGLVALTVVALPPGGSEESTHWHQMSDTLDRISAQALADAHTFTWQVLQELDA
jgi:acetylornithine deacetylase/succinyl-diaminopimelate desuccinylase-like protein